MKDLIKKKSVMKDLIKKKSVMKDLIKDFKESKPIEKFAMLMVIPIMAFLGWFLPLPIEAWISVILLSVGFTALVIIICILINL